MTSIGMDRVPTDYRRVIFGCLGGRELRKLKFKFSEDIDPVSELLPFYKLDTLSIDRCTLAVLTNSDALAERVLQANCGYLSKLKSLKVETTCLGHWSPLFECPRPLVTHLHLFCCHASLPTVSKYNWSDTPQLWPDLRSLRFCNSVGGATIKALESFIPH